MIMGLNGLKEVFKGIIGNPLNESPGSSEMIGNISEIKEEERSQLSLELGKTEIVNDVEPFMKIMKEILESCIEDPSIKSPDEFLQCVTKKLVINVLNFEWLSKAPKDKRELERVVKECGIWNKYFTKFNSIGYYRVKFSAPRKSDRVGIKRIPIC